MQYSVMYWGSPCRTLSQGYTLLNEESDGHLIFKVDHQDASGESRTSINLLDLKSTSEQVLYEFATKINLTQASVNQSNSVLAAVLQEPCIHLDTQPIFRVLVIDLYSDAKPLEIKCETNPLKVQFRYLKKHSKNENLIEHQLLIFSRKHSVSIYQINLPHEECSSHTSFGWKFLETVVEVHEWCEWSTVDQCLYYVHYRSPLKLQHLESCGPSRPMLTCLQFHDTIHYETVLNLPLEEPNFSSDGQYSNAILKLKILTKPKGFVAICRQYWKEDVTPGDPTVEDGERRSKVEEECCDLGYTVTLLHHGFTLSCTIPKVRRRECVQFCTYDDDYILVYLPGEFVHLLDVGLGHELCNHIFLTDDSDDNEHFDILPSNHSYGINEESRSISKLVISDDVLFDQLKVSPSKSIRQAIVHYLLVHRDHGLQSPLKKILEVILDNEIQLTTPTLLQEVLIGGTYAACKQTIASKFLGLLPVTLTKPCEPQVFLSKTGESIRITYVEVSHTSMTLLSPSQRLRLTEQDTWINLWRHLDDVRHRPQKRFSPECLRDQISVAMDYSVQFESPATTPSSPSSRTMMTSPLSPMKKLLEFYEEPRTEIVVNKSRRISLSSSTSSSSCCSCDEIFLPFPEKDDLNCSHFAQVVSTNLRELSVHVLKHHSDEEPNVVHQISTEYAANQLQVSRQVCHYLLGDVLPIAIGNPPRRRTSPFLYLTKVSKPILRKLFNLVEKYQLATFGIAYPVPQGFPIFMSALGFVSLEHKMFLQYVNSGALQLRSEVATFVMQALDDEDENAKIKLEIIMRLPRNKAWHCLETWDHPLSRTIQAQEHCRAILVNNSGAVVASQTGFELHPIFFPPSANTEDSGSGPLLSYSRLFSFLKLVRRRRHRSRRTGHRKLSTGLRICLE